MIALLDGPMGTLLEARGYRTPGPLWTAAVVRDHPEAVAAVHRAYAHAGATVHTAATFRTTPRASGAQAQALTEAAVAICRDAVPAHHDVAGSMAPLEDCYRPDLSPPAPHAEHARFAELLAAAGVDRILVETFANPAEAQAATAAAAHTGLPVWTSLTPGPAGDLMTPRTLADTALRVRDAGAEIVLVNCLPAARAESWVAALAQTGLRWGIYANAGATQPGLTHGAPVHAAAYATLARGWIRRGASVLGACCGGGPDHIAHLVTMIEEDSKSS